METGKRLLNNFKVHWQRLVYLELSLYALAIGCFGYFLFSNLVLAFLFFFISFFVLVVLKQPWQINLQKTSQYIDAHLQEASFSSGLLLEEDENLSSLSKLQRYRVSVILEKGLKSLNPPHHLKRAFLVLLILLFLGIILQQFNLFKKVGLETRVNGATNEINFVATDSLSQKAVIPKLIEKEIIITYPSYTRMGKRITTDPNIKALINSSIHWKLQFNAPVSKVSFAFMGTTVPLHKDGESYTIELPVEASGFYSFTFDTAEGTSFTSDLFSLEAALDTPPKIEISGLPQYTYFDFSDSKQLQVTSSITDDFGIAQAHIIATVSKGSGESVKFREEKLRFSESIPKGARSITVSKQMDLDALKMEVGDELYFYVEVYDEKSPKPNVGRSETYFAVIKDTVTDQFAVEGTLGVDQMPDYFRSQRQLIIDTEKLIKEKPSISLQDFKFRSNELGFDQKALRLKYGQFMGDEAEMGGVPDAIKQEIAEEEATHAHEDGEEDVLKGYTHDHDGDNEHNLVVQEADEENDPLHDYLHNHDDPEESTLFEESLKTKLRKALTIMWDAELHLRLYEPKKSLPFQYDALRLIQEIKNSARIYVHRIGFDPPPIKEENRLTGNIEEVNNVQKQETLQVDRPYEAMKTAVGRLERLIQEKEAFSQDDVSLFSEAGTELAKIAIDNPGKYLSVLQGLKGIQDNTRRTIENYKRVQRGLLSALPRTEQAPGVKMQTPNEINSLFLKKLETYD